MEKEIKRLRRGYTTGACAAAASKAAAQALFNGKRPRFVDLTLPNPPRKGGATSNTIKIPIKGIKKDGLMATARVIKDAGDDPDVTNGATIVASLEIAGKAPKGNRRARILINGGSGVGRVTRAGLAIKPGRAAINPTPLKMIRTAIREVTDPLGIKDSIRVTISVPDGEKIAKKTMNARLGILGGISILGTTGIVMPLSLSAYTDSIICAIDVAIAAGLNEIVLSTGRSSERVAQGRIDISECGFIMTGDHMGFALKSAGKRPEIKKITIAGQFAKFSKLAAGHFETHCTDSSVSLSSLAIFAQEAGANKAVLQKIREANTARQVFFILHEEGLSRAIEDICDSVIKGARENVGVKIALSALLVGYNGKMEMIRP